MTRALLDRGRRRARKALRWLGRVRREGAWFVAQRPLRRAALRRQLARSTRTEDVTVIFAIRNRNDHRLPNALRCVAGQTWPRSLVRVVVVDYGSDPAHGPWLRAQCDAVGAELVRVNATGAWNRSHALNVAIARAATRYTLSIDADTLLSPDYLERAIELLRAQPLGVVVARWLLDLPEDWTARFPRYEHVTAQDVADLRPLATARQDDGVDHLNAGVNLVATALLHAIRGYDEEYVGWGGEDDDVIKRLRSYGADLVMANSYYLHQWHARGNDAQERGNLERNRTRIATLHTAVRNPRGWGRP